MIKLIASDMDGTLLNNKHEIDEETAEAIRKAEEEGIIFVISTGREYENVKYVLDKRSIKCQCILSNGAEYRDENGNILDVINAEKERFFTCLKYIVDVEKFFEDGIEIRKFVAFHEEIELINRMKKTIEKIKGLAVSSSFNDNIEVTDINAQKGIILEKVITKMGIDKKDVMILGDSFNEYSMFEIFEESVAMKNAIPEVKKIAKYITDTNDNQGVAKAIYNVLNNEMDNMKKI